MYAICCQPATQRFKWELEVLLTNLEKVGIEDTIVLFKRDDDTVVTYLQSVFPKVRFYVYEDDRLRKNYISSIRPYIWEKFLIENPEMQNEDFFYIDSDIILREKIDFESMNYGAQKWFGSDCKSYLAPSLIKKLGVDYLPAMARIFGLSVAQIMSFEEHSIGAQWIISKPRPEFWRKVYEDSESLYTYFLMIKHLVRVDNLDSQVSGIQEWVADMWALLWNCEYFGIETEVSTELDFSWPKHESKAFYTSKILHNAGITHATEDLFYKGDYTDENPMINVPKITSKFCSYHYVEAIMDARRRNYETK